MLDDHKRDGKFLLSDQKGVIGVRKAHHSRICLIYIKCRGQVALWCSGPLIT